MTADEWNREYPKGTPVEYTPMEGWWNHPEAFITQTRGGAFTLRNGDVLVGILGKRGSVSLNLVRPLNLTPAGYQPITMKGRTR